MIGVLFSNLGTPVAPTPRAVRRYLAEFLNDRRVVDMPRWRWWPLLYGPILGLRPRRSARLYQAIWTSAGSPLLTIANSQVQALQVQLQQCHPDGVCVVLGMRYGEPSIANALSLLAAKNIEKVLVLSGYPQYCSSTTASTFDAVAATFKTWRNLPELRFVRNYYNQPGYIDVVAKSITDVWSKQGRGEKLLFSFHGLPKRYHDDGDPYFEQCQATATLIAEQLGILRDDWELAFQSRMGRDKWLTPYTSEVLTKFGKQIARVDVVCPGFSADCLETLEEIAGAGQRAFLQAGGKQFSYIPALNAHPDHIEFLSHLVLSHIRDW